MKRFNGKDCLGCLGMGSSTHMCHCDTLNKIYPLFLDPSFEDKIEEYCDNDEDLVFHKFFSVKENEIKYMVECDHYYNVANLIQYIETLWNDRTLYMNTIFEVCK
jgi:hypothetical protein